MNNEHSITHHHPQNKNKLYWLNQYELYEKYVNKLKMAESLCDFIELVITISIKNISDINRKLETMLNRSGMTTNKEMRALLNDVSINQILFDEYLSSQYFRGWAIGHTNTTTHTSYKPTFQYNMSLCDINYPLTIHNHNLRFDNPLTPLTQYYKNVDELENSFLFCAEPSTKFALLGENKGTYNYVINTCTSTHMTFTVLIPDEDTPDFTSMVFTQTVDGVFEPVTGFIFTTDCQLDIINGLNKRFTVYWINLKPEQNVCSSYFNGLFVSGTTTGLTCKGYYSNPDINLSDYMPFDLVLENISELFEVKTVDNRWLTVDENDNNVLRNSLVKIENIHFLPNSTIVESLSTVINFYRCIINHYWCYNIENETEKQKAEKWIGNIYRKMDVIRQIINKH